MGIDPLFQKNEKTLHGHIKNTTLSQEMYYKILPQAMVRNGQISKQCKKAAVHRYMKQIPPTSL
jgi:hypothetical protein